MRVCVLALLFLAPALAPAETFTNYKVEKGKVKAWLLGTVLPARLSDAAGE